MTVSAVDGKHDVFAKIARSRGSHHIDNFVDQVGYAALAGEMEAHPKKETMGDVLAHTERGLGIARGW